MCIVYRRNFWGYHETDALAHAGMQWIEAVLREHAKEKTLTEFLTTRYSPISTMLTGLPVVWKPDLPVIRPIVINL